MHTIARTCLTIAFLCAARMAAAVPFGATSIGASQDIAPCTASATPMSVQITVDVPSRLLVTISGATASADSANVYALGYSAQLFDASGTTLFARSQGSTVVAGAYLTALSDSEVLFDASVSQPYTLASGSYTLELNVETSGACSGGGIYLSSPALTYVLLSSAFDRIFANGFAFAGSLEDDPARSHFA